MNDSLKEICKTTRWNFFHLFIFTLAERVYRFILFNSRHNHIPLEWNNEVVTLRNFFLKGVALLWLEFCLGLFIAAPCSQSVFCITFILHSISVLQAPPFCSIAAEIIIRRETFVLVRFLDKLLCFI